MYFSLRKRKSFDPDQIADSNSVLQHIKDQFFSVYGGPSVKRWLLCPPLGVGERHDAGDFLPSHAPTSLAEPAPRALFYPTCCKFMEFIFYAKARYPSHLGEKISSQHCQR